MHLLEVIYIKDALFIAELHEQRLKNLRELEKQIAKDNWKYTPIEKILGLQ